MQYKILASDYDNTLVPFGEKQPRPAMVKAVKKLQAAGGKFVLSTGRAWSAINRKGQLGGIRGVLPLPRGGAGAVQRKVRPPRPSLHADGRPAARRLPLL